ncbi:MAG: hypothetical protein R3C44_04055 [Chloroflexota bacterium]
MHSGLAGLCFGLAAVTKYQAWLFLPLLVVLALMNGWTRRDWVRGVIGALVPAVALIAWLLARSEPGAMLALQVANAGGLRPAWSWELAPRLRSWAGLWQLSLGWPVLLLAGLALVVLVIGRRGKPVVRGITAVDKILVLFIVGYVVAHWLFAVPIWDRYILPILPLVLILMARIMAGAIRWGLIRFPAGEQPRWTGVVLGVVVLAALLVPAIQARFGRYPIGSQPTADQGAWRVAEVLDDAPYGTVLYDHWYSWQWRYHLFDSKVYELVSLCRRFERRPVRVWS